MDRTGIQSHDIAIDCLLRSAFGPTPPEKGEFAFVFDDRKELYEGLLCTSVNMLSLSSNERAGETVLFAGIEAKQGNGGMDAAIVQLAIWLTSGLERTRQLGQRSLYPYDHLKLVLG
ncbi:MAG: hypothetical protein M1819_003756 [Sarea resinae]|nr:MAG: hypothetical protein M1819_003756 [Sarea resinae]